MNVLAEKYDRELYREQSLLAEEGEELTDTGTLLIYLIETDAEAYTN